MIYDEFDLNSLKIFMSVYESEGIGKASKKLFLTQPAVTIAIKKLEKKLGGSLFVRLSKGVKPTEEADKFYTYCKSAVSQIKIGMENFSETSALEYGSINIGANSSVIKFILMPKLATFCKEYPNIKITFTEVISDRLEKYLARGDIDVAFMEEPIKNIESFNTIDICSLNNVFAINKNSVDKIKSADALNTCPLAVLKENTSSRQLFDSFCLNNGLNISPLYEMANYETLLLFCKNDLAMGFLPKEFIDEETEKQLLILKTNFSLQTKVLALLPKGENYSYACKKLLDFLIAKQ